MHIHSLAGQTLTELIRIIRNCILLSCILPLLYCTLIFYTSSVIILYTASITASIIILLYTASVILYTASVCDGHRDWGAHRHSSSCGSGGSRLNLPHCVGSDSQPRESSVHRHHRGTRQSQHARTLQCSQGTMMMISLSGTVQIEHAVSQCTTVCIIIIVCIIIDYSSLRLCCACINIVHVAGMGVVESFYSTKGSNCVGNHFSIISVITYYWKAEFL